MAYAEDQLFSFRFTTSVPVIPRSVRKTLFKFCNWNPRRHRATPVVGTVPNIPPARVVDAPASAGVHVQAPPTRQPAATLRLPGLVTVASLNARSVRNKSADICDVIEQPWRPFIYDLRNMARESERSITGSRGDPKKLRRQLKFILRQRKDKPPNSEELTAEAFSNALAKKLLGVRSSTASAAAQVFDKPPCTSSFDQFEIIDPSTIRRFIGKAAGKSCELDPVLSWVIEKFADELLPFVAALFNSSMSSGSFPTSQKTASITTINEKTILDPYDLGNYRPISNLTFEAFKLLSFLSVRHTNRLLAILTDFNSFQSCSPPTGNIGQPKQLF